MAIAEGMAYIWSGAYGDINQIGAGNALLILLQLTFAGVVVTMLDEMLQKGYGMNIKILKASDLVFHCLLQQMLVRISYGNPSHQSPCQLNQELNLKVLSLISSIFY